jgi:hypothetical protein
LLAKARAAYKQIGMPKHVEMAAALLKEAGTRQSGIQDKGPPETPSALRGPLLSLFRSYFGSGSAAKFAWTNIHLSPVFTKTRVDFARPGSVVPSLPMVRPT